MYRIALEAILGFHQRGEKLYIEPCIPKTWNQFSIDYRFRSTTYRILVENPEGVERGLVELSVDGQSRDGAIDLVDDGKEHVVSVLLRSSPSSVQEKPEKARL